MRTDTSTWRTGSRERGWRRRSGFGRRIARGGIRWIPGEVRSDATGGGGIPTLPADRPGGPTWLSVTQGELQLQFENRYVRKDGSIAHIRWTARWLPDRQVRLAVAHDITERKAAESMQAVIYAISEAAHTTHNLQALFQHIHQIVGGLLPATNFAVALYDALSDRLSFPYHVNEYLPAPATMGLADDARYAEVIRGGATLLLTPDAPMAHALGGEH